MIDPKLRDFCDSDRQREIVDAVLRSPNLNQAAKKLGTQRGSVDRSIKRLEERAARMGYSPSHDMTKPAPNGYQIRGTSTLYNEDGGIKQQWVKTQIDKEQQESLMNAAFSAMSDELPRVKPISPPKSIYEDLLTNYVITDYHFGMLGWGEETRDGDWDLDIAEELLVNWFSTAIQQSPKAKQAILAQLGDFLHWDGMEALTPANKNILDADTRYQKLVRVVIRAVRQVINLLLKKHESVHVIMAEGNHDPVGSIWLREWLHTIYENEPRITVDRSPDPYYCYEWGNVSLFYHHGHKRKVSNIDDVWVAKFREVFGRTKHSYGHMGHLHHRDVKETNLMVIEQHRTLANLDAYASRGGWLSGKEAQAITYHKEHGEVSRVIINPDMVK